MILSFRVFNKRLNMRADPFFDNRFFSESETPPFVYFADDCFVFVLSFPKRPSNDAPVKILSVEKKVGVSALFGGVFVFFGKKRKFWTKICLKNGTGFGITNLTNVFFEVRFL